MVASLHYFVYSCSVTGVSLVWLGFLSSLHTTAIGEAPKINDLQRPSPPAMPPLGKQINLPSSSYSSLGLSQQDAVM